MSNALTYKLASNISIEVFGTNKVARRDVQVDKDGKYITVAAKWQSNKKNRFSIKKGQNIVPAWVLKVPLVRICLNDGRMTKGSAIGGKKSVVVKKAKIKKVKKPKKPTEQLPVVK